MAFVDKVAGGVLIFLSMLIFAYYSTWVLITIGMGTIGNANVDGSSLYFLYLAMQPFVSELEAWFPAREYAIMIPAVLLVLALTLAGAFVGMVLAMKKRKS